MPIHRKWKSTLRIVTRIVTIGVPSNCSRFKALTPFPMSPLAAIAVFAQAKVVPMRYARQLCGRVDSSSSSAS